MHIQMKAGENPWAWIRNLDTPASETLVTTLNKDEAHVFTKEEAGRYAEHFENLYGAETRLIEA